MARLPILQKLIVATWLSAAPTVISAQEICTGLLKYTGRDITNETRDNTVAKSIYDSYCENDSASKSKNTTVGLSAVVESIPVNFSFHGSNAEEKLSSFCKNYASGYQAYSHANMDNSLVVREALIAFNECIAQSHADVLFRPTLGRNQVSIDIKKGGSNDVTIDGIVYDPQQLSCLIAGKTAGEGLVSADKSTSRALDSHWLSIVCTRLSQHGSDGSDEFPRAEISVPTSGTTFLLPIPADTIVPSRYASDIATRIDSLHTELDTLSNRQMQWTRHVEKSVASFPKEEKEGDSTVVASCETDIPVTGECAVLAKGKQLHLIDMGVRLKFKGEENGFGCVWHGDPTGNGDLQAMAYCVPRATVNLDLRPN